jgi:isopentenyl diphosphate isomerase/L-lactate dehydrogenase-like FMN-dependent dehydrogenase
MYAVAALGDKGGEHAAAILFEELRDVMAQLGARNIDELSEVSITRDSN